MIDNSPNKGFFRIALDRIVEARMREANRIVAQYVDMQRNRRR